MTKKCSVKACKKSIYKDSDLCRIHQSEVRMFGRVRDASERTAKTVTPKVQLKNAGFSERFSALNQEQLFEKPIDQKEMQRRRAIRNLCRPFLRCCAADGCDTEIKARGKNLIYCFDHKHLYQKDRIAIGKALLAIDARRSK